MVVLLFNHLVAKRTTTRLL